MDRICEQFVEVPGTIWDNFNFESSKELRITTSNLIDFLKQRHTIYKHNIIKQKIGFCFILSRERIPMKV